VDFLRKKDIFIPHADKYVVVFYSSKDNDTMEELANTHLNLPMLAIDYYNQVRENTPDTTFLRSGTKNSLSFIQRFNIYESPSIFL
jgi:hypothetical protein